MQKTKKYNLSDLRTENPYDSKVQWGLTFLINILSYWILSAVLAMEYESPEKKLWVQNLKALFVMVQKTKMSNLRSENPYDRSKVQSEAWHFQSIVLYLTFMAVLAMEYVSRPPEEEKKSWVNVSLATITPSPESRWA